MRHRFQTHAFCSKFNYEVATFFQMQKVRTQAEILQTINAKLRPLRRYG